MFKQDKKFLINEGRQISNGSLAYGGFPKIKNLDLQEENITEELRSDIDPKHRKWYLEKVELSRALTAAKKSGDLKKIQAARRAYDEHDKKAPAGSAEKETVTFSRDAQTGHGEPGSGARHTGD